MTPRRFAAFLLVFLLAGAAWMVLGKSVYSRTQSLDKRLSKGMDGLWGPKVLAQRSPYWQGSGGDTGVRADPSVSTISADIGHENRNKGLLWYNTFTVDFDAEFRFAPAEEGDSAEGQFILHLPAEVGNYDRLSVDIDGDAQRLKPEQIADGRIAIALNRSAERTVHVRYVTDGQDVWLYCPGGLATASRTGGGDQYTVDNTNRPLVELGSFDMTVMTNFTDIDYPDGARSPAARAEKSGDGMMASWRYASGLTNQPMGVVMPSRINAGPIAARMSFFAPVSLFFFTITLMTVVVLRRIDLHPMHLLFIAGGFFAFHILLAYLADLTNVHVAFWISAAVSVLLVVSYMRLVAGVKFALLIVGIAQLVYLIGFSYAFFFPGRTGLTVVIGAVATLFVLMQATGRVKWHEVFRRPGSAPPPLPLPDQPNEGT